MREQSENKWNDLTEINEKYADQMLTSIVIANEEKAYKNL